MKTAHASVERLISLHLAKGTLSIQLLAYPHTFFWPVQGGFSLWLSLLGPSCILDQVYFWSVT